MCSHRALSQTSTGHYNKFSGHATRNAGFLLMAKAEVNMLAQSIKLLGYATRTAGFTQQGNACREIHLYNTRIK